MTLLAISMVGLLLLVLLFLLLPMLRCGGWKAALPLALLITLSSGLLYALWGSPRVVPLADVRGAELKVLHEQIKVTSALIRGNPDNLEAWLTVAQAYSDAGDYARSAGGFKQAVLISKGHPRIIMAYAEALIMQDGGTVTQPAKKSIDIALSLDPKLPLARYYMAVWMLQNGEQQQAMQVMKTLYHELPDDSNLKKRMKAEIGR